MRAHAVVAVGPERTALARFLPVGAEHEVIDDQLALSAEQVAERRRTFGAFEAVGLLDRDPRQGAPPCAERIALLREFLLFGEQLLARLEPFGSAHDEMFGHFTLLAARTDEPLLPLREKVARSAG